MMAKRGVRNARSVGAALLFAMALQLTACGGGQQMGGPSPGVTGVKIVPVSASVKAGQTQQFQATVIASPGVSTAVTWSASVGTISNTGTYTAPATVPNPSTVTVTATSVADSTKFSTATLAVFLVEGVSISPGSVTLQPGQGQKFNATVQGQGTFDTTVTWSVNNIPGGDVQIGTITADGTYTAPTSVPNPDPVTVEAVSNADQGVSQGVQVGIAGITSITISPTSPSLFPGQSQQFTATVQGIGTFDPTVVWSVPGPALGTVTQQGLYQVPSDLSQSTQEIVVATAGANATVSSYANVFDFANPAISQLSPGQGSVGDSLTITGQNFDTELFVTFSGPNGIPITTQAWQGGTSAQVLVPHNAITGPINVQETSQGRASALSNSLPFTRVPSLRIRAEATDLSPAETTTMHAEVMGGEQGQNISWSADLGSISASGVYMAPGTVSGDSYAHVSGCIVNTIVCESLIIGIHLFEVQPQQGSLALGNTMQFSAETGGTSVGATWKLALGGGTLSSSGAYTSGSTVADGGVAAISATYSSNIQTDMAAVTGGFPGMVRYLFDYVDNSQQPSKATAYSSTAVSGNKLFALATRNLAEYFDQTEYFIDQYDISNAVNPVWVSSTEAVGLGQIFVQGNYLYEVGIDTYRFPEPMSVIATFDISGNEPILISRLLVPQIYVVSVNTGFAYASAQGTNLPPLPANTGLFYQLDLRAGIPVVRELLLPFPVLNSTPVFWDLAGDGSRLYTPLVSFSSEGGNQWLLAQYDLTQDPPVLMNSIPITVVTEPALIGDTLFVGGIVYDVSATQPVQIAIIPNLEGPVVDIFGSKLLVENGWGVSVVDLSSPNQPQVANLVTSDTDDLAGARFEGQGRLVATGYPSNLSIYDISPGGGPLPLTPLTEPLFGAAVLDQQATASNLFAAIVSDLSSFVAIFDSTASPVQAITRIDMGTANALAVQPLNNILYVGTDQGLLIYDISDISSPQQIGSINSPTIALAIIGKTLFAGTTNNQLLAYDISNASSPNQICAVTLLAPINVLRPDGNLLLLANTTAGLMIYDVSHPNGPSLVADWNPSKAVLDVTLSGTQAFLATDAGLFVADLSNPAQPQILGQGHFPASIDGNPNVLGSAVALNDGIAYLGTENTGALLLGFDVRSPTTPRLVSMSAYGAEADAVVLSLAITPSQLNVGGFFSGTGASPLVPMDIEQPRNTILTVQAQPAALAASPTAEKGRVRLPWVKSAEKLNLARGLSKLRMLQLRTAKQ